MKKMDVTDEDAVSKVISEVGEIDIAILAAGVGIAGAIEETPVSFARRQMNVNYFGVLNVCGRILPGMHANGKGLIIVIGSVAGRVSIPMQSQYSGKVGFPILTLLNNNIGHAIRIGLTSFLLIDIILLFV